MIEVAFPKESKYIEFFERVKDADGNLVLKPYFEFDYKGKRAKSSKHLCLQVMDVANGEFEMTLGKFVEDLIEKCAPTRAEQEPATMRQCYSLDGPSAV